VIENTPVPFDREVVDEIVRAQNTELSKASIREMNAVITSIERGLRVQFVHMEFGIPGLPTPPVALDAETRALKDGQLGNRYAPYDGLPALKEEASLFVRLFMDLDVPPACCIPTIGAMQGCYASLALAGRMRPDRGTILFLEPGFPSNKLQTRFLGLGQAGIDLYDHRGARLQEAIRNRVRGGDIAAIIWSSPNNPSWVVLSESELEAIGAICNEHDVLAIEDLAYFAMDTRRDYTRPGEPPYQPTVMRYTDRAITIVSSSKVFSYAGQRIALTVLAPGLAGRRVEGLERYCGTADVGHAFVHGTLYPMMSCVPESTQHGLMALLAAANRGDREIFEPVREYARRAKAMKRIFLENGFRLVYDNDLGEPLADGFYFTVAYPGIDDGTVLVREIMPYGISALPLGVTGSVRREGVRACVSLTPEEDFDVLAYRLRRFAEDYPR
jgi:aspartate/methionine/tyrosine aminotransferase